MNESYVVIKSSKVVHPKVRAGVESDNSSKIGSVFGRAYGPTKDTVEIKRKRVRNYSNQLQVRPKLQQPTAGESQTIATNCRYVQNYSNQLQVSPKLQQPTAGTSKTTATNCRYVQNNSNQLQVSPKLQQPTAGTSKTTGTNCRSLAKRSKKKERMPIRSGSIQPLPPGATMGTENVALYQVDVHQKNEDQGDNVNKMSSSHLVKGDLSECTLHTGGSKIEGKESLWRLRPNIEEGFDEILMTVVSPASSNDRPNDVKRPETSKVPTQLDGPHHCMGRTLGKVKFSLTEGQLLKHVYLVNKMMRYHETHLNDKECPICQGEEEFQTSSMNSGLGDTNFDRFNQPPIPPDLSSVGGSSQVTRILNSFCREGKCQTSTWAAFDRRTVLMDRQIQSGDPQIRKAGESYFESFLNLSLFPESYSFDVRTDILISLVIVFLFLGVQFLFFNAFFSSDKDKVYVVTKNNRRGLTLF
ncbi:hypothetical protein M8J76_013666 [Diaphorina citri]|nr:hypothetical protein M8J76_013666 [Diaphorina citri]